MKKVLCILAMSSLVLGCGKAGKEPAGYLLDGVWTLTHAELPMGDSHDFGENTYCRIYDGDSMMYECFLNTSGTSLVLAPIEECGITLIDRGHGDVLYLQEKDPHPLVLVNDTTVIIQESGTRFTWIRSEEMTREWRVAMREIITNAVRTEEDAEAHHYVLSAKEREQKGIIHGLVFVLMGIVVALMVLVQIVVTNHRSKRRLQLQLKQIQEEHDTRPQPVRQAMMEVEEAFFASEQYAELRRLTANGRHITAEDWDEMERQLKQVYPGFTSQLRGLRPLSELEYQVCLLIKLRIAPKDMANVLCRDVSTISTVRSRLYQKVFGRKGGAKEWDDFIQSIGT